MPSNWLYIDTNFPTFTQEQSTDEKVTSIQNYVYMLVEQMRYTLNNLDLRNFNKAALDKWQGVLTDPIYAKLEDEEGRLTLLQATAEGLAAQVSDAQGNISALQLTAQGLATQVRDAQGTISALQQTANGLTTRVQSAEGNITSVQQTANKINWLVASGTSASNFQMTDRAIQLVADNISLDGYVTFTNLRQTGGSTVINAGNITTGTLEATNLSLDGLLELDYTGFFEGQYYNEEPFGYVGASTTGQFAGAVLCDSNATNHFIVTTGGARMTYAANGTHSIFVANGGCYSTSGTYFDSDRRVKEDIRYDVDRFEDVFDLLRPCTFYRVGDRSKRRAGLIAQEVLSALEETGTNVDDFGALGWRIEDGDRKYSIAYGELVALCIAEIQRLKKRVKELEG